MIAGLNAIETVVLIFIYIFAGRRLSYFQGGIRIDPPKWVRRVLFFIDLKIKEINIYGILWQILFELTLVITILGYFMIGKTITAEEYNYITGVIILAEWIGIGVPMLIYCGIFALIRKYR